MNNTIGEYEVNITWHHIDGESNRTRIYELGEQLYFGNWTINYFKNDPHPHACDVIFFAWSSSLLPSLLNGLKDSGLRLPVYSYGTNGLTAYMNTSVTPYEPLWDNVVTAETMCDKEMVGILKWLNLEGAKTIFLLWESDAGAYIDSLVSGVRADSAKYGWEIKFDEAFEWKICYDRSCGVKQRKRLDDILGSSVSKKKSTYTADVFISLRNAVSGQECYDEMKYLHDNAISFKAYIMIACVSLRTMKRDIAENNMHHYMISSQGWDASQYGRNYDEKFSSVGIFETDGIFSPREFGNLWRAKFDFDATHSGAAAGLAIFYFFHRDFISAQGIVGNIIKAFDHHRKPETSFYGLMASDNTNTNTFQQWMIIQITQDNKILIVNDQGKGIYPAPLWEERHCFPNCILCPLCYEIESAAPFIYLSVMTPFALLFATVIVHSQQKKFKLKPKLTQIVSAAAILLKNTSCVMSIIILLLQHDAGMIDDASGVLSLIVFTFFSMWFTLVAFKTKLYIAWYEYQQETENPDALRGKKMVAQSRELLLMKLIESYNEFASGILTDLPIAIMQLYALFIQELYSVTLVSSIIMLVYGIGGAVKAASISPLLHHCLEYKNLHMKRNFSWPMILQSIFNPCYTSTQLLMALFRRRQRSSCLKSTLPSRRASFEEVERAFVKFADDEARLFTAPKK